MWVLLHASPLLDNDEHLAGSLCMISDISERKRIEGVLSQREQQLAEAQRVAGLGSFEWDLVASPPVGRMASIASSAFEPQSLNPRRRTVPFVHSSRRSRRGATTRPPGPGGDGVDEIEYRIVHRDIGTRLGSSAIGGSTRRQRPTGVVPRHPPGRHAFKTGRGRVAQRHSSPSPARSASPLPPMKPPDSKRYST